jgi:hypothetical protein
VTALQKLSVSQINPELDTICRTGAVRTEGEQGWTPSPMPVCGQLFTVHCTALHCSDLSTCHALSSVHNVQEYSKGGIFRMAGRAANFDEVSYLHCMAPHCTANCPGQCSSRFILDSSAASSRRGCQQHDQHNGGPLPLAGLEVTIVPPNYSQLYCQFVIPR